MTLSRHDWLLPFYNQDGPPSDWKDGPLGNSGTTVMEVCNSLRCGQEDVLSSFSGFMGR
jgi:hypothetical protein